MEDGLIVDQLIEKTSCNQLRERLLLEPDSTTLADALVIGKQLETALMEARRFGRAVHEPVTSSPPSVQHTEAADGVSDSLDVQRVDRGPGRVGTRAVATVALLNMQPEISHALLRENVVVTATS